MKTVALTALIVTATLGSAQAAQYQFVAMDNSPATKLCIAAATQKPMQLHQAIKYQGYTEKSVARAVDCNNESIASFAARYNPDPRSVERLSRYNPGGKVNITDLSAYQGPAVIEVNGNAN
ncbi:DUF3718 domain-containing protein [Ferrimonas balearica]|uniref:DUF3718 domain-containing protein n=1 Tax=Ferrimonas balearica TaxID=44012 RepID=UPI001C99CF0E|nr:DUF3718 domain-containing protein [Ferrimonas balearica]MBY5993214.1 DUF3718 domain-containing protein [Ferrimonas balearica]